MRSKPVSQHAILPSKAQLYISEAGTQTNSTHHQIHKAEKESINKRQSSPGTAI
jgi:hypothetical protein